MGAPRDPLSVFDDAIVQTVAHNQDLDPGTVRRIVRRHQEGVRTLPGVDNLVYEWRRTLPDDPLVARLEPAFVLVLGGQIWSEFADHLDLTAQEGRALRTVHDRQASALVEETHGDAGDLEEGSPMVLTRP